MILFLNLKTKKRVPHEANNGRVKKTHKNENDTQPVVLEIMNKISHFISLLSCRYLDIKLRDETKRKKNYCEANNDKIITNH